MIWSVIEVILNQLIQERPMKTDRAEFFGSRCLDSQNRIAPNLLPQKQTTTLLVGYGEIYLGAPSPSLRLARPRIGATLDCLLALFAPWYLRATEKV